MRKTSPSNLKDTRLQKNFYFQTRSSNKPSVTLREIKNCLKDYSIEPSIDISYDLEGKIKIKN